MGGLGRIWNNSCSQNRLQEHRGRHRLSTVIQPLHQNAGEVVDLTVDEDGKMVFISFLSVLFFCAFFLKKKHFPPISVFKLSAYNIGTFSCCFVVIMCKVLKFLTLL